MASRSQIATLSCFTTDRTVLDSPKASDVVLSLVAAAYFRAGYLLPSALTKSAANFGIAGFGHVPNLVLHLVPVPRTTLGCVPALCTRTECEGFLATSPGDLKLWGHKLLARFASWLCLLRHVKDSTISSAADTDIS